MKYRINADVSESSLSKLPARSGWFHRLVMDIFFVAKRDGWWWLLPLIGLLLFLAALLAVGAMMGPLAPFIYPIL